MIHGGNMKLPLKEVPQKFTLDVFTLIFWYLHISTLLQIRQQYTVCTQIYMHICPAVERISLNISLTKQQHVVTHKIRQTEIPDLLGSRVTSILSVRMSCGQKTVCPYTFVRTQYAEMFFCWGSVQLLLSAVKLCVGGLRQIAVYVGVKNVSNERFRYNWNRHNWNRHFSI
jgi:hypothetical protein